MNVNRFKSSVKDYARPSLFFVEIFPPSNLLVDIIEDLGDIKSIFMQCEATELPGVTLATLDYRTYGPMRQLPNDAIFADIPMTFYTDSEYKTFNFFKKWVDNIYDPVTRKWSYYQNYTSRIIIGKYDRNGKTVHARALLEAYPISIGNVQQNYGENDSIERFTVTMKYRTWEEAHGGLAEDFINRIIGGGITSAIDAGVSSLFG